MEQMHRIVNGEIVFLTLEEEEQIKLQQNIDIQEKLKTLYIEQRVKEYPPIGEQLDIIFHDGLETWIAKIQEIKDKYPKP